MANITGRRPTEYIAPRAVQGKVTLLDAFSPSNMSPQFQVKDAPVVLGVMGAIPLIHTVRVYTVYGSAEDELLEPAADNGTPIILNSVRNNAVVKTSGRYRVVLEGPLGPVVYVERQDVLGQYPVIPVKQSSSSQYNLPNLFLDNGQLSNKTQIIQIDNKPWVFTAFGLDEGEIIRVHVTYGQNSSYREEAYKPDGKPLVLTQTTNQIRLDRSGRYRFELVGDPSNVLLVGNETIIQPAGGGGGGGELPATTDDLPEGSVNLYFTPERAREAANQGAALVNADIAAILPGVAVSRYGAGYVRAQNDDIAKHKVTGITPGDASIVPGEYVAPWAEGVLELTVGQWEAALGTPGGLAASSLYYLGVDGRLSVTPPTELGRYVVPVGLAMTSTALHIRINDAILL